MEESPTLSFPAILRNPGIHTRFSHLHTLQKEPEAVPLVIKKLQREHEGKRWIRRKDNARFAGNPHISPATKRDYDVPTPHTHSTFPEPLPSYLQRNTQVPTTITPTRDPMSANAGRFSLSLKGMRRDLRKCGVQTELLVQSIEHEILQWLVEGGTVLNPDTQEAEDLAASGRPIGDNGAIFELSRTPLQLVWHTDGNSFARYIVHCCARYYEVVSFSKELHGRRLTYLLRPNVTKPDHRALGVLDTPPVTDIDYSSHPDTESDHGGVETDSDIERSAQLSAISEDSQSLASPSVISPQQDEEAWSLVGDTDVEGDESGSDADLATAISAVALVPEEVNETLNADVPLRQQASFRRRVRPHVRAHSSPSRSPARRPVRWASRRYDRPRLKAPGHRQSFYDYLYS